MQESRPGGDAPLPFMGRTTDKGRFRFRFRFRCFLPSQMRWSDSLTQFAKTKDETWEKAARDGMKWSSWEDEFAAKRW